MNVEIGQTKTDGRQYYNVLIKYRHSRICLTSDNFAGKTARASAKTVTVTAAFTRTVYRLLTFWFKVNIIDVEAIVFESSDNTGGEVVERVIRGWFVKSNNAVDDDAAGAERD